MMIPKYYVIFNMVSQASGKYYELLCNKRAFSWKGDLYVMSAARDHSSREIIYREMRHCKAPLMGFPSVFPRQFDYLPLYGSFNLLYNVFLTNFHFYFSHPHHYFSPNANIYGLLIYHHEKSGFSFRFSMEMLSSVIITLRKFSFSGLFKRENENVGKFSMYAKETCTKQHSMKFY